MLFAVLYGSVRSARVGIRAARFIVRELERRGHAVSLLDPLELDLPLLDRMYKEYGPGAAPPAMAFAHGVLEAADGIVVVGGEYNHSVPPALKNLIDHFQTEYFHKPAAIVSYSPGPFGGARAAPHYRIILGELGMVTVSTILSISRVHKALDEDGNDITPNGDYKRRAARVLNELEWYADALAAKRSVSPDPTKQCGTRLLEELEARTTN